MLAIRLQRLGRKALPVYRLAVQESQRHPSSGRVVAYVGSYNPHTKETRINTEKVAHYLGNGAQPTPRVVRILKEQKVDLPAWVKDVSEKKLAIRHPEKLRRNQPKEEAAVEEAPAEPAVETTDEAA
ncbi:MAG TPA: 30S ribosomal protein S16 [Candidatus Saccharimonadales bacterium]|jgi:small subunit ribosomal protein S16